MKKEIIYLSEEITQENLNSTLGYIKEEATKYGKRNFANALISKVPSYKEDIDGVIQLLNDNFNLEFVEKLNLLGIVYRQDGSQIGKFKIDTVVELIDFTLANTLHKDIVDENYSLVFNTLEFEGMGNIVDIIGDDYKEFFEKEVRKDLTIAQMSEDYIPNVYFKTKRVV